jgi:magnesium transporter
MKRNDKFKKRSRAKRRRMMPHGSGIAGVRTADEHTSKPALHLISYDANDIVDTAIESPDELDRFITDKRVAWIDVQGLGDTEVIGKLCKRFGIHQLILEDILFGEQRPKAEQYGDRLFVVLRNVKRAQNLETDQLSILMIKNCIITLHESAAEYLEPLKQRVRENLGGIREAGADYLLYAIIDAVIDEMFPILERYGDEFEDLEDEIIDSPSRETVGNIHAIKRDLLSLRRVMWPTREVINSLIRDSKSSFAEETLTHLRDCYDHSVQIIDFIETYRELGADLMDVYLSSLSNKMNEVMKVLTIITTMFVPPGLIAAIYGMNFKTEVSPYNMPELSWRYGYIYALVLMAVVSLTVLAFLWWKGWLEALSPHRNHHGVEPVGPAAEAASAVR